MQYFTKSQNNRLNTSKYTKNVITFEETDASSDASDQNNYQVGLSKLDSSMASTLGTKSDGSKFCRIASSQIFRQQEDVQICSDFINNGYCLKGRNCCFSHQCQIQQEKKQNKKPKHQMLMLQNFPELIMTAYPSRMRSFLQ